MLLAARRFSFGRVQKFLVAYGAGTRITPGLPGMTGGTKIKNMIYGVSGRSPSLQQ